MEPKEFETSPTINKASSGVDTHGEKETATLKAAQERSRLGSFMA